MERFVLGEVIGRGGMGEVVRAYDRTMGCDVAVKMLQDLGPEQVYRLKREFRILSGIAHPNLVELFNLIVDERGSFFTMELLDGASFLDHVRWPGFDEGAERRAPPVDAEIARLREALRQLASGLGTLHASGRLHCDIKPANVMITRGGRVVLLDFGLAASLRPEDARADMGGFFGTVDYMSPEQAWDEPLSPASDWYSVGAMAYHALTGRLPFEGLPERTVVAKKGKPPPPPGRLVPGVPEDLDRLVTALLQPDPRRRPPSDEIAALLSDRAAPDLSASIASKPLFVGRNLEIAALEKASAEVRGGASVVVHVHGPSGMGKTALIRELLQRTETAGPSAVFHGRCHPQESVPYKGLDSVVDGMSRLLASLGDSEARALVPRSAAALVRLFPVLGTVPGCEETEAEEADLSAQELRRRAIAALRDLLVAIAGSQPVVVWIDDLQWSDPDSIALLADLLRLPGLRSILVLLSYRREEMTEEVLARMRAAAAGDAREIAIGPLGEEDIAALTGAFLGGRASAIDRHAAAIAHESGGSPFLVGELSRWLAARGGETGAAQLNDVVRDRIGALPPPARRLLEVVSLAGRPLSRGLALTAAGLTQDPLTVIPQLRLEQLLKGTSLDEGLALEPGHDRIREAVLQALSVEGRRERHRDLVGALEAQPAPDPQALLDHLLGAGENEKARGYAVTVAERAAAALAFNRAAEHYRLALNLGADSASPWSLREKLGAALASAGRTAEAAEAYERAAAALSREDQGHGALLGLRRNAAEQHLRGGQVEQGLAVMREVLATTGVRYPETTAEAIATILALRGYVALRGFKPKEGKVAAARELSQMDACWSAGLGLNMIDILRSAVFQARHTVLALRTGDPRNVVRALTSDITYSGCEGGAAKRARVARLREDGKRWLERHGEPELSALMDLSTGAAWYFEGRFHEARADLEAAESEFSRRQEGITWEILNCRMYRVWSFVWQGELLELGRVLPGLVEKARAEKNPLALAGLCSAHPNVVWLAADRADEAAARSAEAIAPFPRRSFQSPHYFELIAATRIDLYRGDGEAAFVRMEEAWPKLKAIQFLRMQFFRVELSYLRALAALSATWTRKGKARKQCLAVAEAEARRLAGEDLECAAPLARMAQAGLAGARGREAEATRGMAAAAGAAEAVGLGLHAAAARIRAGERAGEAWMTRQGVARPARMAAVAAPEVRGAGERGY